MNRIAQRLCLAAIPLSIIAPAARAQAPAGYDSLSPRAVAESLKVLATLQGATRANANDTASWFRGGKVAFALAERAWEPRPPAGIDRTQLRVVAREGFEHAMALDGNNPQHWLWLGRFHATACCAERDGAGVMFDRALGLFRQMPDKAQLLELLVQTGEDQWHWFDLYESRGTKAFAEEKQVSLLDAHDVHPGLIQPSDPNNPKSLNSPPPLTPVEGAKASMAGLGPPQYAPQSVSGAASHAKANRGLPRMMAAAIGDVTQALGLVSGFDTQAEDHFLYSQKYFEEAHALAPSDERVFRGLAKVRVARGDHWAELQGLATERIRLAPGDPWGSMALGLAYQRLKLSKQAQAAFDLGLAQMNPVMRAQLDRIDRVLTPRDAGAYARSDSAARAGEAGLSWKLAEPLWSEGGANPHTEFLARLTYAELRWGAPEKSLLGADTPMGMIYVRYGPPDAKRSSGVGGWVDHYDTFWMYNSGLIFAFSVSNTEQFRGAATYHQTEPGLNARIAQWQPARWDNIADATIDSMPVQVARFRASADSVDVFLATRAPMEALAKVATTNATPYANFWFSGLRTPDAFRDSLPLRGAGSMQWTRRVPQGPYYYRVESIMPGTLAAGRAAAVMTMGTDTTTGFSMRGFAISDMIVASRAESRGVPHRWSDIDVAPALAAVAPTSELSLVWETYEAGRSGTAARYHVTITLSREPNVATPRRRISARIVRGITGNAAVNRKEAVDEVTFQFEREVPYAPALVDNVALSLDDTPPGNYLLKLEVTDRVTGRTTSRATGIVVHE